MSEDNIIAPDGKVWVCLACGKYSKDKFNGDRGWDTSCMMNSSLFDINDLQFEAGRVVKVQKKEHKNIFLGDINEG